jgi:hypothetical protein
LAFNIIAGLTGGALVVPAIFGGRPAGAENKHTIRWMNHASGD